MGPIAVLRLTWETRLSFPLNSLVTFVDSYRGGTLGGMPMGRGLTAPTPLDTERGMGALSPVLSACDQSQTCQGRLTCVNRAAPLACPRRIKCGEGRLGRYSFKTLGSASCFAHLAATRRPDKGLGAARSKAPRGETGHPEAPWPLYDRLTSPKGGRGETRPRGHVAWWKGSFPLLCMPSDPYHRQESTPNYSYMVPFTCQC